MRVSGDRDGNTGACAGWRRARALQVLWAGLAGAMGLAACAAEEPAPARSAPQNLLLVTIDTLRADHLGSYGYARNTSPRLDEFAARSLLFENAIAQSAVTPVSHASILTGRNPFRHGLRSLHGGRRHVLPDEQLTLAEILQANGRTTGGFVSAFPAGRFFGLDQGFQTWDEEFTPGAAEGTVSAEGFVETGLAQRRAGETTQRLLAWLETLGGEPFFAWIHYFDVHDTELPTPGLYASMFPPASDSPEDRSLAFYDAEIAYVDTQVGRVLSWLDSHGLTDSTVVAVLADHGQGLGDHGWWGHSILFQEQLHVPFLLSVPHEGWAGRVDALVRTIDLVPTLVDVMALSCPDAGCDFDGISLRGVIEGSESLPRIAYSESINDLAAYENIPNTDDSLYAVNDGRFKLIAFYRGAERRPSLLFDLKRDPWELRNLGERHEDVRERLHARVEALGAVVEDTAPVPLDPEARERLEALGYMR